MKIKNLKLRKILPFDFKEILKIEKSSFPKSQAYSKSRFVKYYRKAQKGFIVAEKGGKILGYIIGQAKNRLLEIISVAVAPERRQKRIGTKLFNFLLNHFKNIKEIFLHVRTKNHSAISFYKKLGFKIYKEIKRYYRNGDNAFLMKKKLGA